MKPLTLSLCTVLVSAIFLSFSPNAYAKRRRAATSSQPSSTLVFQGKSISFGTIFRGQKIKKSFRSRNSGAQEIGLNAVYTSCGCMVADLDSAKKYKSGEEGEIGISFDSTDFSGSVEKIITVVTDEKQLGSIKLTLMGQVDEEINVNPPILDFGEVGFNASPEQRIRLKTTKLKELKIDDIKYNSKFLEIEKQKISDTEWILKAKLDSKNSKGFIKDKIIVRTNAEHLKDLPIPLRASVVGNVAIEPNYIEFGTVYVNETKQKSAVLKSTSVLEIVDKKIQLLKNERQVEMPQKFVTVSIVQKSPNEHEIKVEVRFANLSVDEYRRLKGNFHGRVMLQTKEPAEKNIALNFYGLLDQED